MAEMTIRLKTDAATGKKNIVVSLRSDEDMLPHEHEQQHRSLVEQLIDQGIVEASEMGNLVIEREEESTPTATLPQDSPQHQRESQQESN